jgi:hypothetical protein
MANSETPIPEPDEAEDAKPWQQNFNPAYADEIGRSTFDPDIDPAALDLSESIGSSVARRVGPVSSSISTTFVWSCKLGLIAERVLGTVYSLNLDLNSDRVRNVVSELEYVHLPEDWLNR